MTHKPPSPDTGTPAGEPAIDVRAVHKHFGALRAVDGIDLRIERGEMFGLIGHNGAGKSTLFKMILGLLAPTSGDIRVMGAAVHGKGFREARRHVGYLPENVVLYDNLTGLETLAFFARLKGVDRSACQAALDSVGLSTAGQRTVREYSKGMRQRLGFAQALLGRPQVLLLDEPTNGLDPSAIREFYATLRHLQHNGVTVVITSHILSELQERVDRVAILAEGHLQALGSVKALRQQAHVPLRIEATLEPHRLEEGAEALAALAGLPGIDLNRTPTGLHITCPQTTKIAALGVLATFGPLVTDISIHEPSLEDVFFDLREQPGGTPCN